MATEDEDATTEDAVASNEVATEDEDATTEDAVASSSVVEARTIVMLQNQGTGHATIAAPTILRAERVASVAALTPNKVDQVTVDLLMAATEAPETKPPTADGTPHA